MRIAFVFLSLAVFSIRSYSQSYFNDGIKTFYIASSRIFDNEEVPLEWKMDGELQAYMNEGLNSIIASKFSVAEANFDVVAKKDPTVWQAFYYRAVCRKQLGKLSEARSDFEYIIQKRNSPFQAYIELGKICILEKNPRGAEKAFDHAIKTSPEKPLGYYLKANVLLEEGQINLAVRNYNLCLEKDKHFSDAKIKIGIIEIIEKKQLEAGLSYFNSVLEIDSLNINSLMLRSLIYLDTKSDLALADLNLLARLLPGNIMVLLLRGLLLAESGDYEKSFFDLHKVIQATEENPNRFAGQQTPLDKKIDLQNAGFYTVSRVYGLPDEDAAMIRKAFCQISIGKYTEAINSLNEATESQNDPLYFFLKGVANEHGGNHPEALKYYNLALKLDNDILDAHKKRGIYEQELKQWKKAIADFSEMIRINPYVFVTYKLRGLSYYYDSKFKEAVDDYTKYLQKDSLNVEVIGYRGMAYMKQGLSIKASIDFINSKNLHMVNLKELYDSLDHMLQIGDTTTFLTYLNKVISKISEFTGGYLLRAKVLINRKDWVGAERDINDAIRFNPNLAREDHSCLISLKGSIAFRNKRYDDALDLFKDAIKLDKKNSLAFLERAKLFIETGRNNKAIEDLRISSKLGNKEADNLLLHIPN